MRVLSLLLSLLAPTSALAGSGAIYPPDLRYIPGVYLPLQTFSGGFAATTKSTISGLEASGTGVLGITATDTVSNTGVLRLNQTATRNIDYGGDASGAQYVADNRQSATAEGLAFRSRASYRFDESGAAGNWTLDVSSGTLGHTASANFFASGTGGVLSLASASTGATAIVTNATGPSTSSIFEVQQSGTPRFLVGPMAAGSVTFDMDAGTNEFVMTDGTSPVSWDLSGGAGNVLNITAGNPYIFAAGRALRLSALSGEVQVHSGNASTVNAVFTSNAGPGDPINRLVVPGSAPQSAAGNGTAAVDLTFTLPTGGASSGTTGQTGGPGSDLIENLGAGGAVAGAGGIGGPGGSKTVNTGNGGNGATTGGKGGDETHTLGNAGTGGNANGGTFSWIPGARTGSGVDGKFEFGLVNGTSRGQKVEWVGASTANAPAVSAANAGSIFYNSTVQGFQTSANGGAYTTLPTGGVLVGVQVLTTTGASVYTKNTSATSILIHAVAGGGGGGGAATTAAQSSAGGGGGSGSGAIHYIASASATYDVNVGTGGAGGTAGDNPGSTGGATTFAVSGGATIFTCNGGLGGAGGTSVSTQGAEAGGAGGAISTGASANLTGSPGGPGLTLLGSGGVFVSGNGGASMFGGAALGRVTTGTGSDANSFGGGGAGGGDQGTADRAGGAGKQGVIIVYEFK